MKKLAEITQIQETELAARENIDKALQQAQKIVANARLEAQSIRQSIVQESKLQADEECRRIENETNETVARIMKTSEEDINLMNQNAKKRQAKVAAYIIEKVLT